MLNSEHELRKQMTKKSLCEVSYLDQLYGVTYSIKSEFTVEGEDNLIPAEKGKSGQGKLTITTSVYADFDSLNELTADTVVLLFSDLAEKSKLVQLKAGDPNHN
jgi:hypothetical protein